MLSTLAYIRSSLREVRDEARSRRKKFLNNLSGYKAANIGAGWDDSPLGWWSADKDTGFVISQTTRLPLRDASLDFVYCSMFLEHIDDDTGGNLFSEIARVLKPGKSFRVVVPDFWLYLRKYREGDRASLAPDAPYIRTWERLGVPVDMEHLLVAAISRIHNMPHIITHYPHRENMRARPPVVLYPFEDRYDGYDCGPAPEMTAGNARPLRLSALRCGVFLTASGRAFVDGAKRAHRSSAGSRQEAVVPPGGAPTPPECRLRAGSAGAAPARGPELPGAGCRVRLACSPAALPGLLHHPNVTG